MKNTWDLTLLILPRAKKLMLASEDNFKQNIKTWLSTKGFMTRVVGGSLVEPIWKLVVGPLLPTIIKIIVDLIVASSAPTLLPLLPFINKVLDFVDSKIFSADSKYYVQEIMSIVQNFKPDEKVQSVVNMTDDEAMNIVDGQEYFSGIAGENVG